MKRVFILLTCTIRISFGIAQNTSDTVSYALYKNLENSKLKHIFKMMDSVGIASPIKNEALIKHAAYFTSWNSEHQQPNYVVHVIPKDILYGNQTRTNDFRTDPLLKQDQPDSTDYWNSGYDRGHMAASADFKWNKKALSESYYYTNISPQNHGLNQNAWNKLEMTVREWAIDYNELIVVTGPVLTANLQKIQQGSMQVSIPEYFFKLVLDYYPPKYKAIAFIYPNKDVPFELDKHVVSIDSIEQLTGINFFQKLPDVIEDTIETQHHILDWDKNYFKNLSASVFVPQDYGKKKINTLQAKEYIGKEACVCGKVVSTKYVENGKSNPTYINLDKKFPDQVFTLIIYGNDRSNFSYTPEDFLKGKTICVKGQVGEFKGIPQIIANKEKQIEVVK